jgi:hypothetical protein
MGAFDIKNWSRLGIGGAIGNGAGSVKSVYGYWSPETIATIEGSGYLDTLINDVVVGDIVHVVAGIGGTPTMRSYFVSSVTDHVVLSRAADAVTGGQTPPTTTYTAMTGSTGTADGAWDAIGATNSGDVSTAIKNNFAEVNAKIVQLAADMAAMKATLHSAGVTT